MLHAIAEKLDMTLDQLKGHLAYNYGINEDGFLAAVSCFETLPDSVQAGLLSEADLTEEELEKDEDDQDQDEDDGQDQDEDQGEQQPAEQDETQITTAADLKLDNTPAPATKSNKSGK